MAPVIPLRGAAMKQITAIIKPFKLEEVREALAVICFMADSRVV